MFFADEQSDGEDDDYRTFSRINASSSPASTPPQPELPGSPDLSEKINGPSASMITTVEPVRLLRSPEEFERTLSHRTSGSADDIEAELLPASPSPSTNASQNPGPNTNSNQEESRYLSSQTAPVQTQSQFPSANISRFRRGTFQIRSPAETPLRFTFGIGTPQSQDQPATSQTLRSSGSSRVSGSGSQSQTNRGDMSWLNTQAFRPPETQDSYESD